MKRAFKSTTKTTDNANKIKHYRPQNNKQTYFFDRDRHRINTDTEENTKCKTNLRTFLTNKKQQTNILDKLEQTL